MTTPSSPSPRRASEPAGGGPYGGEPATGHGTSGSMVVGGLIMLVLVVLLSWLPLLGPLVAGMAGGWIVADPRRAVLVALLPAVALAAVAVLLLAAFDLPVLGAVAGFGVFAFVVVQEIPLLLGAYAGGSLAQRP